MTCSPEACAALGVTQSMGRVGSALDNAAAESFNSTLEHELLSRRHFATKDQARREVARFIDAYNHRRRHSSCEMLAPVAYEQVLAERAAETRPTGPGRVKPASQIASEPLGATRWHQGAGEWEAPSAISNPPRNGGKPMAERYGRLIVAGWSWRAVWVARQPHIHPARHAGAASRFPPFIPVDAALS